MRIAGGIMFLVIGILGIGFGVVSGMRGSSADEASDQLSRSDERLEKAGLSTKTGSLLSPKLQAQLKHEVETAQSRMLTGFMAMIIGLIAMVSGILLLLNKGRIFGIIVSGMGALTEVLFIVLVGFSLPTLILLLGYGFSGFAASRVGKPASA